jgi:hypothetical protein
MDRKYYDRFGYRVKNGVIETFIDGIGDGSKMPDNLLPYLYNPEYKSLFCDNEQHEVAVKLNRYKFFKRRLFNHNHPAWGLAPMDALIRHTESFHEEDKATYNRRKAINFNLPA